MTLLRSYATIAELLNGIFGTHMQFPVFSFGFFVGLAFVAAGWVLYIELRRKEKAGLFTPTKETVIVGKPASTTELIWNAVVGYIIGFKVGGIALNWQLFNENPQSYVFSTQGNIVIGLIGALVFGYWKYRDSKKSALP